MTTGNDEIIAIRIRAAAGDAHAQYTVGIKYAKGEGVLKDNIEAAKWHHLAAEQGHAGAQTYLGLMYYAGEGVTEHEGKAVEYINYAVAKGYAEAQAVLGMMYYDGKCGFPQNREQAFKLIEAAAKQEIVQAQYALGNMYFDDERYPEQNYIWAYIWFSLAVANGHIDAVKSRQTAKENIDPKQLAEVQNRALELMKELRKMPEGWEKVPGFIPKMAIFNSFFTMKNP